MGTSLDNMRCTNFPERQLANYCQSFLSKYIVGLMECWSHTVSHVNCMYKIEYSTIASFWILWQRVRVSW